MRPGISAVKQASGAKHVAAQARRSEPVRFGLLAAFVLSMAGQAAGARAGEPPVGEAIVAATGGTSGPNASLPTAPTGAQPAIPQDTGAASGPETSDANATAHPNLNDPFEPMNRAIFQFDVKLDRWLLKPAAKGYRTALPKPMRNSVRNLLDNLASPITLANSLLQANWPRAGETVKRFAVNTTLGVGGLFDPATKRGLPRYDEDLGQTFAVWGVSEGPYLVLPILGPRPPRDALGWVGDHAFDPLTYIFWNSPFWQPLAVDAVDLTDKRSRNIETVDQIERTSLDFYATVRSLYRQTRNAQIQNAENAPASATPVSAQDFEFDDRQPAHP